MGTRKATLKFDTKDTVRINKDGSFAVYIEPTGITVFGDTREEALSKGRDAVMFLLQTIKEREGKAGVQRYLERHEVPYTILERHEVPHTIDDAPLSISRPLALAL